VRPLELRIVGLRSYRAETTVDFSDLGLLAIIGATGSGKSSLLEAITYALYGTATWGGGNVTSLIADGALRMTVSLSFQADGENWQITRSAPSAKYPPASQELICLSDPARPKVDRSADVKRDVARLVGLDYDGFKSCVLLPQGRFDQLLKSTPANRVAILKGILGLGALDATRTRARALEQTVADRLVAIVKARGRFLENPQTVHDSAAAQISTLTPRVQQLTELQERVQTLVEEVRGHSERAGTAAAAADTLIALLDDGLLGRLHALQRLDAELAVAHATATSAAAAADRAVRAAAADVKDAKANGRDAAALTGLRGTITAARTQLGAIAKARADLVDKRAALTADQTALADKRDEATRLTDDLTKQTAAEQRAEAVAAQARQTAAALLTRIELVAAARDQLAAADIDLRDREQDAARALQLADEARARQLPAAAAREQAQAALDDAQRADAAAQAAHDCHPGDNCPVCSQQLPDTFLAPEASGDVAALRNAVAAAEQAERAAFTEMTRAEAAETTAAQHVAAATHARDTARARWTDLQATPLPAGLDAATVCTDAATLTLVNLPADDADRAHRQARQAREVTSGQQHALAVEITITAKSLAERDRGLREQSASCDTSEQEVRDRLKRLPHWIEIVETAGPADLDACEARLQQALQHAETREQLAASTAAAAAQQQSAMVALTTCIQREVERPAAIERDALRTLAGEVSRHREQPLPAAPATPATVTDLIAWGEQITAGATVQLAALQAIAQHERQAADDEQRAGVALLNRAGYEKSTDLRDAVIDAAATIKHATAQRDIAAAQLAPAAQLDRLAARAEQLRDALRELVYQLADGKFAGFVVDQRQQALLALASGILSDVTAGQYGFTKDFDIVDRRSATARTPDTLSGGETFLASLALALGLVELAGRSGGRLQALFLDEGFGSLDPDALDQALTELERRADTGRLIAIISHVPAIAERIDQVLQVNKTPRGSEVQLLTEAQRDALLLDDATEQTTFAA
jgi:exonuclease SbcC